MTDNQFLYFVIVLLYLSECLIWVSSRSVAFSKSNRNWRVLFSSSLFGNESGGLALAYPFPFLGRCYITHLLPLSFSPKGIVNTSIEVLTKKIPKIPIKQLQFDFNDIRSVDNNGNILKINDALFCKCGSSQQAKAIATAIEYILQHKDKQDGISKFIDLLFDTKNIKDSIGLFENKTKVLTIICNTQFYLLMLVAPALVYVFGSSFIIWSGLWLVISNIIIIIFFNLAHIGLYPDSIKERITDSLKMFFCPPLSIRAIDILSLQYLSEYHPVAVASVILEQPQFESFAKQSLLSYNFPYNLIEDNDYKETLKWHLNSIEESIKQLLVHIGFDLNIINAIPIKSDDLNSFCPRCHAQFLITNGQCPECTGVSLIEYTDKTNDKNK